MEHVEAFEGLASDWVAPFLDEADTWDEPWQETRTRAHKLAAACVRPALLDFPAHECDATTRLVADLRRKVDRWLDVRLGELYQHISRARLPEQCATLMICGPRRDQWRAMVMEGYLEDAVEMVWDPDAIPHVGEFVDFRHVRDHYIDHVVDCLLQAALMEHYVTRS